MASLRPAAYKAGFAALALGLISGCATQVELDRARQDQINTDARQCMEYGLHPESQAFAECRMQLDIARRHQAYPYYEPYPRYRMGFGVGGGRYHRW